MTGLQKFLAGLALLAALAAAAMIGISGTGHKFGAWDLAFARDVLLTDGAYGALAAGGVALAVLLLALARRSFGGAGLALFALLVAAGAAYVPLSLRAQAEKVPELTDITTDPDDPPAFVALASQRESAGRTQYYRVNYTEQHKAYPEIVAFDSGQSAAALFGEASAAVDAMGWIVAERAPEEGRIEATAVSEWFGLRDDVVIRVRPHGAGARLDIRSASRAGTTDLGANAAHIRAILDRLH